MLTPLSDYNFKIINNENIIHPNLLILITKINILELLYFKMLYSIKKTIVCTLRVTHKTRSKKFILYKTKKIIGLFKQGEYILLTKMCLMEQRGILHHLQKTISNMSVYFPHVYDTDYATQKKKRIFFDKYYNLWSKPSKYVV